MGSAKMERVVWFVVACIAVIYPLGVATAQQAAEALSLQELRDMREELAQKPRRLIANNDGCDCLYFPGDREVTVENFLNMRTTPLAGSQVDTIYYCTISSGFSFFTHDTEIGTVLTRHPGDYGIQPNARNITQDLIDLGSDCLQSVVDFGHDNDMEVFWSFRMNDTHDAAYRPDKPYLLYPPLKEEHPEWLVGNPVDRTPYGRWSSVNYAIPEIRDLAFRFTEEVCRNYDVDGIELDYFRHLCYFPSVANGGVATDAERDMMTDLMRRIREMTEEVGRERGRPILVSVRVPDSVGFCRDMGFDIERWMEEDLFDILVTTGYFRLNPWEYSVELGHRYGVQVYPCLSDSRVRSESRFRRMSIEGYRGRAMNAWNAGADGIYTFNMFNPNHPVFNELGDPESMATLDKLYFVTARDGNPESWLAGGSKYRNVPILTPAYSASIGLESPLEVELTVGEDFEAARAAGGEPETTLHLEMPGVNRPEQVQVSLNGQTLSGGVVADGWLDIPVSPDLIERGTNTVRVAIDPTRPLGEDEWTVSWQAGEKPGSPWYRDPGSARTEEVLAEGGLLIADRGEESGDYHYYRFDWGASPGDPFVVEAEVQVVSGSSFVIVSNGEGHERLGLWPDRIELWSDENLRYEMDTTDGFHTYRIEVEGEDLRVYVDGELRIDAPGSYEGGGNYPNQLAFGAANSAMVGEAWWRAVRARTTGIGCRDMVLSVTYQ